MLLDLTFPCYLTTFSGKKCQSGKVICAFFCPAYRSSPVDVLSGELTLQHPDLIWRVRHLAAENLPGAKYLKFNPADEVHGPVRVCHVVTSTKRSEVMRGTDNKSNPCTK
jgi:hypothetical protein